MCLFVFLQCILGFLLWVFKLETKKERYCSPFIQDLKITNAAFNRIAGGNSDHHVILTEYLYISYQKVGICTLINVLKLGENTIDSKNKNPTQNFFF